MQGPDSSESERGPAAPAKSLDKKNPESESPIDKKPPESESPITKAAPRLWSH